MVTLEKPDIIVGTPSRILAHLKDKVLYIADPAHLPDQVPRHIFYFLPSTGVKESWSTFFFFFFDSNQTIRLKKSLEILVIDEADLLFSFGYEEDLKSLLRCGEGKQNTV